MEENIEKFHRIAAPKAFVEKFNLVVLGSHSLCRRLSHIQLPFKRIIWKVCLRKIMCVVWLTFCSVKSCSRERFYIKTLSSTKPVWRQNGKRKRYIQYDFHSICGACDVNYQRWKYLWTTTTTTTKAHTAHSCIQLLLNVEVLKYLRSFPLLSRRDRKRESSSF